MRSGTLRLWLTIMVATASVLVACPSMAVSFYASFSTDETIDSTTYLEEDIVLIDGTNISLFEATASLFSSSGEDIDALFVGDDGDLYFSTSGQATLIEGVDGGSTVIESGDVIRYSPTAPAGSQFSSYIADVGPNIDALWIENGVPYLSFGETDAVVGGNSLNVLDDQVFTLTGGFDLSSATVTVVLDSNDFLLDPGEEPDTGTDIDAFAITDEGDYLFSSSSSNSFLIEGGDPGNFMDFISRDGGVVYKLDPSDTGSFDAREESSIFYDPSAVFSGDPEPVVSVNVDALHFISGDDPPTGDADFNDDGIVNIADYTVWRDNLGGPGPVGNADGVDGVTAADYDIWKSQFGNSVPLVAGSSLAPASVPEPATWVTVTLLGSALMVCRRRIRG